MATGQTRRGSADNVGRSGNKVAGSQAEGHAGQIQVTIDRAGRIRFTPAIDIYVRGKITQICGFDSQPGARVVIGRSLLRVRANAEDRKKGSPKGADKMALSGGMENATVEVSDNLALIGAGGGVHFIDGLKGK